MKGPDWEARGGAVGGREKGAAEATGEVGTSETSFEVIAETNPSEGGMGGRRGGCLDPYRNT